MFFYTFYCYDIAWYDIAMMLLLVPCMYVQCTLYTLYICSSVLPNTYIWLGTAFIRGVVFSLPVWSCWPSLPRELDTWSLRLSVPSVCCNCSHAGCIWKHAGRHVWNAMHFRGIRHVYHVVVVFVGAYFGHREGPCSNNDDLQMTACPLPSSQAFWWSGG